MKKSILPLLVLMSIGILQAQTTYLHCGQLIDATSSEVKSEMTIIIEGDKIMQILSGYAQVPADAQGVDLKDKTVMPGLIDMHVHIEGQSSPKRYEEQFRLNDADVYEEFYNHEHPAPELLEESVYGLPEVHAKRIRSARLIASPGCYPTSILLPLIPLLAERLIAPGSIHVTSMSGASGAGKSAKVDLLFAEVNESVRAYSVPKHRHLSEVEQELSLAAGEQVTITFLPHLLPVTAGIHTSTVAAAMPGVSAADLNAALQEAYATAPFVRLLGEGQHPDTKNVTGSNFIDIACHLDPRTGRTILLSAEDNLGKGAASQAIQSFNLVTGQAQTSGLGWV